MFQLTRDNYYTPEADWAYMSCSQYDSFMECEAKAMAKLEGRWEDGEKEAFLVGNYFHTFFEGPEAHEQFCKENFGKIFKTKVIKGKKGEPDQEVITGKYAAFDQADKMIEAAMKDPFIRSLVELEGENEKIFTGELFGVPWRIRVDKYVPVGRLVIDYKTVANINELKWSEVYHEKVSFIDAYGYMRRAAVYSEIEKQNAGSDKDPMFIIIAISKQDPPDKEALSLNSRQRYDYELETVAKNLQRIQEAKERRRRPKRCGCCDYCRATKKLYEIKHFTSLLPDFRGEKEDDFPEME